MVQLGALDGAPERWAPGDLLIQAWQGVSASDHVHEQPSADIAHEAEERLRGEHERMMEEIRATAYE
ncbi:MAG: hypothetical protein ACR2M1_05510 [Gemmatimonadaceae bacterium]